MGAWGAEIFENDDAADLVEEVMGTSDLSRVAQALDAVLESPGYLEAPVASEGLAAADIVARLRGHTGQSAPFDEELSKWIKRTKLSPDAKTVEKARTVVDRVRTEPSELLELWSEGDPAPWLKSLDALQHRLTEPPRTGESPEKKNLFNRLLGR
jgi:hypothetical protein